MFLKKIISIFFLLDARFYNFISLVSGLFSGLLFGGVLYIYGYLGGGFLWLFGFLMILSIMYVCWAIFIKKNYEIHY